MAAITSSNLSNALKKLYAGQKLEKIVFNELSRPFLTRVKKMTSFQGEKYPIPVMYEDVGGGSNTFSTAQSNVAAMALATFEIDVKQYYRVLQVNTLAMRRSKSDLGSFLRKQEIQTTSILNALANDLEKSLYRTSDGHIGVIAAGITEASTTCTLATAGDAKNFNKGDKIVAAADAASAVESDSVGVLTIAAVNYSTGVLTTSANMSTASWAAGNLLFRQGDYVSASDRNRISGLADWIPSTQPTSGDSFFGQDRSSNPTRLAGYAYSGSLSDIENSILKAAVAQADFANATPDVMFCDYTMWGDLAKEMGVDVRRKPRDGKGGFENLYIAGPRGIIEIVPATYCQPNTGWLLEMDSWELVSAGGPVEIFADDGMTVQRVYNADALEVRAVSYPQLACYRPANNCQISFS